MEPATTADAVTVIEHANFAVSDTGGDIAPGSYHGFFVADTRHLSRLGLRLGGRRPERLTSAVHAHGSATFYLTNPAIPGVAPNTVSVVRDRTVGSDLRERIRITSYDVGPTAVRLTLHLAADFADIFEVRGRPRMARSIRVEHGERRLTYTYEHRGYERSTVVTTDRAYEINDGAIEFDVELKRGRSWELLLTVSAQQTQHGGVRPLPRARLIEPDRVARWARRVPSLTSDDRRIERAWSQAIVDMGALLLSVDGGGFIPAAGLPWYMAVFGRDATITTMQTMLMGSDLAFGTLHQLAEYQGRDTDDFHEEEPGKIPHEVRTGELATLDDIPHARYYGSADATPLFVLLFIEACRWSGWLAPTALGPRADGRMPTRLRAALASAEAALAWIEQSSERDGLIWYRRRHRRGIRNQVWKDSNDSYRFTDGRVAEPPIAAVEVQGYAVAARRGMADVFDALRRNDEATAQRKRADDVAARIEDSFWMPEAGTYAMGLDQAGTQIDAIASNPGHLLWNGVVSAKRARAVAERLLAPDMFSGWGIRTMSAEMAAYNPISYHNGSVWPHDNSLIAAGLARYGLDAAAWRVIDAQLYAAETDPVSRLPELFAGFDRRATHDLVKYPAACAPQAWATGAIVLAVQTLLRLAPGVGEPTVKPLNGAPALELRGARIGRWKGAVGSGSA